MIHLCKNWLPSLNRKRNNVLQAFNKYFTFSELKDREFVKMKKHLGFFLNCSTSD